MYTLIISAFLLIGVTGNDPLISISITEGVISKGYEVLYGDKDISHLNEVVTDIEKDYLTKDKINYKDTIKPLPAQDVKCLMSVDRYCSTEMRHVKGVLIQALKNDCEKCNDKEKDDAGQVVAAMMTHDPVAWKMFLTRSTLQIGTNDSPHEFKNPKFALVGEPEIINTKNRYVIPGVKVRVKRYIAEKIL